MPQIQMEPTIGSVPVPDPTVLTTASLLREIGSLRELLLARITALENAVALAHENLVRVPTETDKAIDHLREVVFQRFDVEKQKFIGIQTQFEERDTRVEQTATAYKEALGAALQAQKEAVGKQNDNFSLSIAKSETATNKQIDQLGQLQAASAQAANEKIDDLKQRITLLEGQDRGKSTAVVAQHAATWNAANIWGIALGIIGTLIISGSLILAFATRGAH